MAIKFINIDNGESYSIDKKEGKFYRAKLSALINSSNLSINADRGQDFGIRLDPAQQAEIEAWEQDSEMVDKVSAWSKTPSDSLSHMEFLSYMLYQQELSEKATINALSDRRAKQQAYEAKVNEARKPATIEEFMSGAITGDVSGDKPAEEAIVEAPTTKKK